MPKLPERIKRFVAQRGGFCCEYCQSQSCFSPDPFAIEHIIPRSRGGTNNLDNLALSCQGCNAYKYATLEATDPITGAKVKLFHPRQHNWPNHFSWNYDFTRIVGLTPIGRATIAKLKLNRKGVVNLRRVLHATHNHPPPDLKQ